MCIIIDIYIIPVFFNCKPAFYTGKALQTLLQQFPAQSLHDTDSDNAQTVPQQWLTDKGQIKMRKQLLAIQHIKLHAVLMLLHMHRLHIVVIL